MNDDIRNEEELTNAPEDAQPVERQSEGAQEAPEETEKPAGKEGKPKKTVGQEIREWVIALAAAVLIALLVRTFLFTLIGVDGHSMDDTLHNGERLFVSVLDVRLSGVERGDVVICHYPGREENFVKRVIGLPGDVVEIRANQVYVNGEPLSEPYLTPERNDDGFSMAPFALGADEYFVMGDNRDNSHDSRNYYGAGRPAAITRKDIVGRVRFVMWPLSSLRGVE